MRAMAMAMRVPALTARKLVAVTVLLTASGAVLAATSLAAGAAETPRVPVVYGVPFGHPGSNFTHGRVRPTGLLSWTGDGSAWFEIRSYSSWGQTGAWASATVHVRSCWGSCDRFKTEHAILHFYRVRTHRQSPYFTRLRFRLKSKVAGLGSSTLEFCSRGSPAWYYTC
jgi:hypothetical protein